MKKTTLQEVKDGLFISMTPKEKFDYDSQRIQDNCGAVTRSMLNDFRKIAPIQFYNSTFDPLDVVEFTESVCPKCGAPEIEANTPKTVYKCGSMDYDQRPGTFQQSERCRYNFAI